LFFYVFFCVWARKKKVTKAINKIFAPISKKLTTQEFFVENMSSTPVGRAVAARLKDLQHEFKDGDEFIARVVDASFDRQQSERKQTPNRQKRLSFLRALKRHETNPDEFDFDSLQEDRVDLEREKKATHRRGGLKYRAPKTLFDLLDMLAQGKLRGADRTPQEFPAWLLSGLETIANEMNEKNEANETNDSEVEAKNEEYDQESVRSARTANANDEQDSQTRGDDEDDEQRRERRDQRRDEEQDYERGEELSLIHISEPTRQP
jgi:hypothetical protein